MMKVSEFKNYLKTNFAGVKFYNGSINREEKFCVSTYARGSYVDPIALGGKQNKSFRVLPITVLVHWGEDADVCETKANEIYEFLLGKSNFDIGTRHIISVDMLDPCPINISRDEKNIAEMTFRVNVFYKEEVI